METNEIKKPRLDIMIDMETVGLTENAGILSIAAVPFFLNGKEHWGERETFTCGIDLTSCFMTGMNMTGSQDWWMEQDEYTRAALINEPKEHIIKAIKDLYNFLAFLGEEYELYVWSRGSDFDFPKLEYNFRRFVSKKLPYEFYNKRDARTLIKESGIDESQFEFVGYKHTPYDDCCHQVKLLQAAYKQIFGVEPKP